MGHPGVARVVLGLAAALALAVIAAHPRVRALEDRLGLGVLSAAGIPFLALGAVFSTDTVGILTPTVLEHMRPAFEFGLGWIGLHIGLQFDVRRIDRLPAGLSNVVALECVVPMVTTFLLTGAALLALGLGPRDAALPREALVLAACAAPSAPIAIGRLARRVGEAPARLAQVITELDEVVAFAVLGLVCILFRPDAGAVAWVLPRSAWLLVMLGLGGILGIVTYVLLRGAHGATEELAVLLGAIALTSGMAGYLALSPAVVGAIAGALLANLPLEEVDIVRRVLHDVERPLFLIFLVVAGAEWRPGEWQGWALAVVYVLARIIGKRSGSYWARRVGPSDLPSGRDLLLALSPQSPNSIVVIVSAATLYGFDKHPSVRWATNAVILGAVLTEMVVRLLERRRGASVEPREATAS